MNEMSGDDVSLAVAVSIVATHFKNPERKLLIVKKIQNLSRPSSFLKFLETQLSILRATIHEMESIATF